MITNLMNAFTEHWPYFESTTKPFIVEDTGKTYRLIIKNTCEWYKKHGGCTMCNYTDHSGIHASSILKCYSEQIIEELLAFGKKYNKIKFYVNGSFFNDNELSQDICIPFIKRIRNILGISELCVETRSEYLSRDILLKYKRETGVNFEICFGLESTNDKIRNQCIHKGMLYSDFLKVFHNINDICSVKVYLLIKPPFISEKHAIEDVISSVKTLISDGITIISYTPVAIQKNTLLEFLLQENLYRPVWIWSIIEINSQIKDLKLGNTDIHLGGLDYYPEPLQKAFNCECCSDKLLNMLVANRDLTWDDFDYRCDCYYQWRDQIENEIDVSIEDAISQAEAVFEKVVKRSVSIYFKTNSHREPKILRDIAKTAPLNKYVLDQVGIEKTSIPLNIFGYMAGFGECTYSIELDVFHRGIHMSRLIERLNAFARKEHKDILSEMEYDLLFVGIPTTIAISFRIMDTVPNPLTDNTNFISLDLDCRVSSNINNKIHKQITVTIPFINACPCTKETVEELFGETFTHTQRGRISITFMNCALPFNEIIEYVKKYISILDLLKREDEVYIVNKAHDEALFCEDICRRVTKDIKTDLMLLNGSVSVRVTTEESIHPHNAFAEKAFELRG